MTQWQQLELDKAESLVLTKLFGQETIPNQVATILNCLKINPNHYIQRFEKKIEPFLRQNGMVDGEFLSKMITLWKPDLAKSINIPCKDFRLYDFVDDFFTILVGKGDNNYEQ